MTGPPPKAIHRRERIEDKCAAAIERQAIERIELVLFSQVIAAPRPSNYQRVIE
jgi:hypothetical protein